MADPKPLVGTFHFSPRALFQLGAELITNEYQAILELVKNAADAKSPWCHVEIWKETAPPKGSAYPNAHGYVTVTDAGRGMSAEDLLHKWLHVSSSDKRQVRSNQARAALSGDAEAIEATAPLGEKGVGRLSAQRLGDNIEIYTAMNGKCHRLALSWRDFENVHDVSEVKLKIESIASDHPLHVRGNGTMILVSGLQAFREPDKRIKRNVYEKFSRLLSPFPQAPLEDFDFEIRLNGEKLELLQFDERFLKSAQRVFHFTYSKKDGLQVDGSIALSYSGARTKDLTKVLYERYIEADRGRALFEWIQGEKKTKSMGFTWQGKGHPYHFEEAFASKDLIENQELDINSPAADPGPLEGWLYAFDLNMSGVERQFTDLFDIRAKVGETEEDFEDDIVVGDETKRTSIAATRTFKALSGVHIYRDGFELPMPQDWLNLGAQSTESSSYYNIRPSNVLGIIRLRGANNPYLTETTNREALVRNPAYHNFYELMQLVVERTRRWQALVRRSETQFLRKLPAPLSLVPGVPSPLRAALQQK